MSESTFRKLTGFMFIVTPLWLFANSRVLGIVSGFPNIQFQPIDVVLQRVAESGTKGVIAWYLYIIPGVLYIASVVMIDRLLAYEPVKRPWFPVATTLGVVAWALQFLGLTRWIFVYPYLADVWVNQPQNRDAVTVVYNAFNNYAGYALGQTVGIGLTAIWILLLGIAMLESPMFERWLGWVAILVAIGELIGNLGPLGALPGFERINVEQFFNVSGLFWYISYAWMALLGVIMIRWKGDVNGRS